MAFFLVALPVAIWAGFGTDRLLRREVTPKALAVPLAVLAGIALLGVIGVLGSIATLFASEPQAPRLAANAGALRLGAGRLLLFTALAGAAFWGVATGRLRGLAAAGALAAVVVADLWSVDRRFFEYRPAASELFADDAITGRLRQEPKPYRVLDAGVYQGSVLMAYHVPTVLGYHGNEVRFYDELLGGKNVWSNIANPNLHDLLAVRFLLLPDTQAVPGFHRVAGPVPTAHGSVGVLYQRDTVPPYVRVLPAAAKLPEDQLVPTVIDPRFPVNGVVVFPESASVSPSQIRGGGPEETEVRATLAAWKPGSMQISLTGSDTATRYLLVSETWYKDWRARVDGRPAPVLRGDHALITVALPPGAREVALEFSSPEYARGKLISLLALLAIVGLRVWAYLRQRRAPGG
jgi:hypothetical protein